MKNGTTPTLKVQIQNFDISKVQRVEFAFKAQKKEAAQLLLKKCWPDETSVTYDEENGLFLLRISEEESRIFVPNSRVYMDTRITMTGGTIPTTSIAEIFVTPTLFEEAET